MVSWFKKYDFLTLKNPNFLNEMTRILSEIPHISPIESIEMPIEDQRNYLDQQIALSTVDFENMLQKTLIKVLNILISFFKSEYFVVENPEFKAFCSQSFEFLNIERRYFIGLWTKQNAVHANFIMNRILASFIRILFFLQEFHRFILNNNENLVFIEAEPIEIKLNYDNVYAIIDCLTLVLTSLLQKLSHLKNFLQNELNFLLRIYFFLSYFKTFTIPKNLLYSKQKFPEKDLENLIYLILDTTKTTIIINKGLLGSSQVFELEPEYEEDKSLNNTSHYDNKDLLLNGNIIETPTEKGPLLLNENNENPRKMIKQASMKTYKIPKLVKGQSVFFDELNEEDEIKEETNENNILTVKKPGKIRKSLLGDTRNSLIAELLATSSLNTEENLKKASKFADLKTNPEISITSQEEKPEFLEKLTQARSGIVRNMDSGGSNSSFWKYLNNMNPSISILSPINDKDSIMNSEIFKKSVNLPINTVLSTIHPSIIYYKAGNNHIHKEKNEENQVFSMNNQANSMGEMGFMNNNVNSNLIKSMSSKKFLNPYEQNFEDYYDDIPKNQKFEAINENLNDNLVKFLMDYGKKEPEKQEKDDKDAKNAKIAKKENKEKKMNLFVKELEGDSMLSLVTKGDEDTPKNTGRRTLSGKKEKELKKQLTSEKEEEGTDKKHKRKSQKSGTKKLGITEKDLIKIDKNTEIKEKLIYSSFQEKLEDNVPRDEDILVTTLSSEADEIKKKNSVAVNSFVNSILIKGTSDISKTSSFKDKEIKKEIPQPHYKLSSGVLIPFFIKRENEEELKEKDSLKVNRIAEEALNDSECCEEYNEFYVARKKGKKNNENLSGFSNLKSSGLSGYR